MAIVIRAAVCGSGARTGCHDTVASVVSGSQLMCVSLLPAGAQTSGHEEGEHSDQEAQTQDAEE